MTTAGVILSHSDNECTAYPFWGVVKKGAFGRMELLAGVWFNREDAERFLNATRHRYGDKAYVYCFSGHDSWHVKELYSIARKEVEDARLRDEANIKSLQQAANRNRANRRSSHSCDDATDYDQRDLDSVESQF